MIVPDDDWAGRDYLDRFTDRGVLCRESSRKAHPGRRRGGRRPRRSS